MLRKLALVSACVAPLIAAACSSSPDNTCSSSAQALTVCAKGTTVKGVDVSYYQGTVDFAAVKKSGRDFVITRVSDGTGFIDPKFAGNWKAMKAAGLVRGVYQFFRPAQDPTAQANLLISQVKAAGGFVAGDLPPVMDIEVTDGQSASTIQAHMKTWLTAVENAVGAKPLIYTALFMSSNIGSGFGKYPLWVANWGVSCPSLPSGWSSWVFWQDADNGTVSGIANAVDTDVFNGSLTDLQNFANPPAPPPPASDAGTPKADAGTTGPDAGDGGGTVPPAADAGGGGIVPPAADAGATHGTNPCAP